jgi:flagellar export protein FliJ
MAKRFKFRLEVVRKLRQRKEDERRRIVAERFRLVGEVRGRIGGMNEQLRRERGAVRGLVEAKGGIESPPRPVDVTQLRRHHVYVNHLRRCIAEASRELADQQVALAREQALLTEASKDLKVIDKLEERQRARYELGVRRAELAESDEIGAQFARRVALARAAETADGDRA